MLKAPFTLANVAVDYLSYLRSIQMQIWMCQFLYLPKKTETFSQNEPSYPEF